MSSVVLCSWMVIPARWDRYWYSHEDHNEVNAGDAGKDLLSFTSVSSVLVTVLLIHLCVPAVSDHFQSLNHVDRGLVEVLVRCVMQGPTSSAEI